MRGRVGRSNHKAFCYLLIPSYLTLTPDAQRRLKAIEEFSNIGSGFNIAMRDLDIRGAGNILGAEQSGFISEIGYDMYHKILNEAIEELKESDFKELFAAEAEEKREYVRECTIETDQMCRCGKTGCLETGASGSALVRMIGEKLSAGRASSLAAKYKEEGRVNLNDIFTAIRIAKEFGIEKIVLKQGRMVLHLVSNPESPFYQSANFAQLIHYASSHPTTARLKETPERLTLAVGGIDTIGKAIDTLLTLTGKSSVEGL